MIIIGYWTIMDGQVLRWYRDETVAGTGDECLSVSRNGVRVFGYLHDVDDHLQAARDAHRRLQAGEDVQDVATHTIGFFGRDLTPIDRTEAAK